MVAGVAAAGLQALGDSSRDADIGRRLLRVTGVGERQGDEHVGGGDEQSRPVGPLHRRIRLCRKVENQKDRPDYAEHEHHQLDADITPERGHGPQHIAQDDPYARRADDRLPRPHS